MAIFISTPRVAPLPSGAMLGLMVSRLEVR